jgi:hypothetical protein
MYEVAISEKKMGQTLVIQLHVPLLPSFEPATYDLDFFNFSTSPSSSSSSSFFCLYTTRVFTYPDFFYVALLMSSIFALCVHPNKT